MNLAGRTIFISGASRGIGLAIVERAARDGANVIIAAKTTEPHPKLPGTIYTAAEQIEAAGGKALPVVCDIRDETQVLQAVQQGAEKFGFDLMFGVNVRGTYLCTQAVLPHLKASAQRKRNPHVLTLSPPLNMDAKWFAPHVAYTMAKYGMSMCVLGHAQEFKPYGIAVNALWPRTVIQTAAIQMIPGVKPEHCRTPAILADAAYYILTSDATAHTGNFYLDDEVLAQHGVTNLEQYSAVPGSKQLLPDLFL
jgi:citronellol/citronellal dehydrogenase